MGPIHPDQRFADALIQRNLLDSAALQHLLRSRNDAKPFEALLLEVGLPLEVIGEVLQSELGIGHISLTEKAPTPPGLARLIPEAMARHWLALAVALSGQSLEVAMVAVTQSEAIRSLEAATRRQIIPVFAHPTQLKAAIERAYQPPPSAQLLRQALEAEQLLHPSDWPLLEQLPEHRTSLIHAVLASGKVVEPLVYAALGKHFSLPVVLASEDLLLEGSYPREEARLLGVLPLHDGRVAVWDPLVYLELRGCFPDRRFVLLSPAAWEQVWRRGHQPTLPTERRPSSLAEALVMLGLLDARQAEYHESQARNLSLGLDRYLRRQQLLPPQQIAQGIAFWSGRPYIDPLQDPPDPAVKGVLAKEMVAHYKVLPHHLDDQKLVVLLENPLDMRTVQILQNAAQREIVPAVSPLEAIEAAIQLVYERQAQIDEIVQAVQARASLPPEAELRDGPAARLVQEIVDGAIGRGASDIHFQAPEGGQIEVRYRIDGDLLTAGTYPSELHQPMVNFIKVIASLDIGERRLPQDGRTTWNHAQQAYDLRVASSPGVQGEKVVLRLLASAATLPTLGDRGFPPEVLERFRQLIGQPYGLLLITGPTGSGKTFTSFAALAEIATPQRNVQTIENPVELRLPGIHQLQINPRAGLTFASALRAFLRQDPDVLLVGEIRDGETAQLALEAANTGHLVLSSMHTNSAPAAISRLRQLGVDAHQIVGSLLGVLAQRLVKRVCPHCSQPNHPLGGLESYLETYPALQNRVATLRQGTGCRHCGGTGYRGRTGLFELMVLSEPLQHLIMHSASTTELRQQALRDGMTELRFDGLQKAWAGLTTLSEVHRHTLEVN